MPIHHLPMFKPRPKLRFQENAEFIVKLSEICERELTRAGYMDQAERLRVRVEKSRTFAEALSAISRCLDIKC